jgi:hypothetical protein
MPHPYDDLAQEYVFIGEIRFQQQQESFNVR